MRKVGIVTIFDLNNYGNRLQNYAVEQILKKCGVVPTTLVLPCYGEIFKYNNKLENFAKKIYSRIFKNNRIERYLSFLKFQKNMNAKNISNTSDLNDLYDMFIVGSDQVWHPDVISDDMFLRFAEKKKRATISPSFGLDGIPKEKGDYYRNGLCGFNKITVREESGKDIIEGLCDVQVDVNLDPVFMLDSEEWDRVSKPVKGVADRYIIKCMLGDDNLDNEEIINKIAQEKKIEIIDIHDESKRLYKIGPGEFIWLIKNAQFVITNSFHAIAFSVIYRKDFVALNRYQDKNDMNTRLEYVLKRFGLIDQFVSGCNDFTTDKVDYTETMKILKKEQDKMMKYIRDVLQDSSI